jgi:glutathione S-transferase
VRGAGLRGPPALPRVRAMPALELIELYPSPWSERVRWALEWKRLPYRRREYVPLAGEDDLRRETGIDTVPVLVADGDVVGDSNAALDWLEDHAPGPALLPGSGRERAQVRAFELAATETLAPAARLVAIGRWLAAGMQPFADHFARKYGWSTGAESKGQRLLGAALADLTAAVADAPYLVGDGFTRADLTVAAMLATVFGHPDDGLFALDAGMRVMFGIPRGEVPELAPLRRWRDDLYRRHRGGRVAPAAA